MLAQLDVGNNARREQLSAIDSYLSSRNVDQLTAKRIASYYGYLWKTGQTKSHQSLLADLPDPSFIDHAIYDSMADSARKRFNAAKSEQERLLNTFGGFIALGNILVDDDMALSLMSPDSIGVLKFQNKIFGQN